jgi:hypothetical protein
MQPRPQQALGVPNAGLSRRSFRLAEGMQSIPVARVNVVWFARCVD